MKIPSFLLIKICFFIFSFLLLFSPDSSQAQSSSLKNGNYQFKIHRADGQMISFNTIVKDSAGKKIMYVKNGSNLLLADSILFKKDSVFIELPFYESGFAAQIKANGNLRGDWIKKGGDNVRRMPFDAVYGEKNRFKVTSKPAYNVTGRWEVPFVSNTGVMNSVGEFTQKEQYVTGTFLTPYGDYRFLEGVVSGDSLYLSGFDGSYAMLFTAVIKNNQQITEGKLYSGAAELQTWTGIKNSKAVVEDGYSLSKIKPDAGKVKFAFPDMHGKIISNTDPNYKGKLIVIQILGSWCPNCLDETKFLSDNYEKYRKIGVEFIGIAYERTDDYERSKKSLQPFINNFKPAYPILIAPVAVSDTLRTEKTFPQIDKIAAFPTTIFIDKDGYIVKVHAGFDGPATGIHYEEYQKEFEQTINELLKRQNE